MKNITPDLLPPILPDIGEQLREYLICPDRLPIHKYEHTQEFWPCEKDVTSLFELERAPLGTTLMVQRDHNTGKIIEFREVAIADAGSTAKNSMSLQRAPGPPTESIRGDDSNFPFWPGGLPAPEISVPLEDLTADFTELLTVPPGFDRGLVFAADGCTVIRETDEQTPDKIHRDELEDKQVNLMDLIHQEQDLLGLWNESKPTIPSSSEMSGIMPKLDVDESEVLSISELPVLKISDYKKSVNAKWAVLVDIEKPVDDFYEKIPELAHEYPFELDTFQKQAILKLEENCDVFVAAHTSAGKTVVAEYAIALSQKHRTRTIYTSPIKALSNQKYRDFKHTFEDVGLITGDFQINQTGVCLIMTTEILRSMLYGGSDVIRDLEYVIFDEVHYINDAERGHVWEEVLILLPSHVRIVLLSATVPNTLEFASWLGNIKQRKVYVISTLQRPVPLQHYLYTGKSGKNTEEKYLVIDAKGNFHVEKHQEATRVLKEKLETNKGHFKDRAKQDETAWSTLIEHLKKNDLLPTVVFTFSRARCDKSGEMLGKRDLTTDKEKRKIHQFYQQCIKRLKKPDQELPQIIKLQSILKNGIGVHHSGILPIVKEIVEMLFQNGLVKILFATETFAMGVNMPARTVIFNGIEKFDGIDVRFLKPAEYIQMAGRAGRRGLDKTGTVIIRCMKEVPDINTLKTMMQGRPQKLESQFRLTYGMLLTLLRVKSITVESVMTNSFHEVNHVSQADTLKVKLKKAEDELAVESTKEISDHLQNLVKYYTIASDYIKQWNNVWPKIMQQQKVVKEMTSGRVLLISYKDHIKKLALLLNINSKKGTTYKVLVLIDQKKKSDEIELIVDNKNDSQKKNSNEPSDDWYKMLSYATEDIFQPNGVGGHTILEILPTDILEISTKTIKVDTDLIIKDWEKRQIPRFRDDPPGQTCYQAIQELTKLTNSVSDTGIQFLTIADFHIADIDMIEEINYLKNKKKELDLHVNYTKIANFKEQFGTVYKKKDLEQKVEDFKFMMSHRSLNLYPQYMARIEVLRELGYINEQNNVQMKGRVACIMGMNELLITELVFRNTLANLQACEVAALLSALVFQAKSSIEPELTNTLKEGVKEIEAINKEIEDIESRYHITSVEGRQSNLNFQLVQVVYEWARQKPFAEIMSLTDIQEGIIVRCIQQLNEILKDVKEAAVRIGNPVLQQKMDEASNAIKRDIVFAASLYTQRESVNIPV